MIGWALLWREVQGGGERIPYRYDERVSLCRNHISRELYSLPVLPVFKQRDTIPVL